METCIYRLRRTGDFRANLHPLNQCGREGQRDFKFDIEVAGNSLDERGFLIDTAALADAMTRWNTPEAWTASSEQLCGGALVAVHDVMGGRAREIRVRIIPNEVSHCEIYWREGMPMPTVVPTRLARKYRLPGEAKFAGKTLDEVPESYVYYLKNVRPSWADMIAVQKRINEIENQYR